MITHFQQFTNASVNAPKTTLPAGGRLIWSMALAILLPGVAHGQIVLNEILADNQAIAPLTNFPNYFPDYVELYNTTSSDIDLAAGRWSLSTKKTPDPLNFKDHFFFPPGAVIRANSHLLVFFDDKTTFPGIHTTFTVNGTNTTFSLKSSGDEVLLFKNNKTTLVDSNGFGLQIPDHSIGRVPSATGVWQLTQPTPARMNVAAPLADPANLNINEWMANDLPNSDWFEVYNPGTNVIDLSGLVLSDMTSAPTNRAIPALSFIAPHGFVQFIADNLAKASADHVDFSLSDTSGQTLTIYAADRSTTIDQISFPPQTLGLSQGRLADGSTNLTYFPTNGSTPGANNFLRLTNVVINEVLSHTDPPLEDAIELYNPTDAAVDISHWWLSNNANEPEKYSIPAGTIVPARSYRVFYEFQFNSNGLGKSPSFTLNSAHGDEVHLFGADANGNRTGYRRSVTFGSAQNGVSFGRYITSAGTDFVAMSRRSFGVDNPGTSEQLRQGTGLTNAYPLVGPIVLNELMYHPPGIVQGTNTLDNTIDEFIELYNITGSTVTLYDPHAKTNHWKIGGGVDFEFPPSVSLGAGSFLLVVNFNPATNLTQLAAFRSKYNVPLGVQIYGPYKGNLNNGGASIELYKPDPPQTPPHPDAGFVPYILVDRIKYADSTPWPTNADGLGASLQRISPVDYGNDPVNWKAEAATAGRHNSTPGLGPPIIITQPQNQTITVGTSVTFTITASGASPFNYQWRFNGIDLPGKTNSALTLSTVRWNQAGSYSVVVFNASGVAVSHLPTLTVTDITKPPVTISSPAVGARLTNATITIQGTASDAGGLARVEYQLGSSPLATATGTTNWSAILTLAPGTNTLRVKAVDLAGNESLPVSRSFIFVVLSPLTVQTSGNGTVTPSLNGQTLEVGRSYTLAVVPGSGFLFSNWTGGVVSSAPNLRFLMQSNLVLQANFVTNPFIAVKGAYSGLFYETNRVLHESSGSFKAMTTDLGTFTAGLQLAGKRLSWKGKFNLEGKATNQVPRLGTNALTVELQMGLADNPDQMTGRISDGVWQAELLADRAWYSITTNRSPHAGRYTLAISGTDGGTAEPAGHGCGSVVVDVRGNVTFLGMLGDGSRATQKACLSKSGQWPLYMPLYAGKGSVLSWATVADSNSNNLTGLLSWIKPTLPLTRYCPGGFTNETPLMGSIYVAPATTNRVLNITNAVVLLARGNLGQPFTNNVVLGTDNKVRNTSSNSLVLTIALPTGLFTGTVTEPGTGRTILVRGALLQKQVLGCGFFLGTNQSGRVTIEPAF